jgi:hypothetical protein
MTSVAMAARAQSPPHIYFRVTTLIFAVFLAAQCIWLLLAEFSRPRLDGLPLDAASAAAASKDRELALWAATVGIIRGDLWAISAFTYADVVIDNNRTSGRPAADPAVARLRASAEHALNNGPTQSAVWLLRTGLALRYPSGRLNPLEPLRMSYYTGPSDQGIVPLRLQFAAQADGFGDIEIREFAIRDIRMLLATKQYRAIAHAHEIASNAGKQFIEQTVHDIDPSAITNISLPSPKIQPLPD